MHTHKFLAKIASCFLLSFLKKNASPKWHLLCTLSDIVHPQELKEQEKNALGAGGGLALILRHISARDLGAGITGLNCWDSATHFYDGIQCGLVHLCFADKHELSSWRFTSLQGLLGWFKDPLNVIRVNRSSHC
jgi:hypothetical protein